MFDSKYMGLPKHGYMSKRIDDSKSKWPKNILAGLGLGAIGASIVLTATCLDENLDKELKKNTKPVPFINTTRKQPYLIARENYRHEMETNGKKMSLDGRERWEKIINEYNQHLKGRQIAEGDTLYLLDYKPFDGKVLPED